MRLRTFYANEGDCLLLTSDAKENVLVDGGPSPKTFGERTNPTLLEIAAAPDGEQLDLVVVSHIDRDHIAGILDLIGKFIEWRKHDAVTDPEVGTMPDAEPPPFDRPPNIVELWHNSWKQHLGALASKVSAVVNQAATTLADSVTDPDDTMAEAAEAMQSLAESVEQGAQLQDLTDMKPSPIARNEGFADNLVTRTDPPVVRELQSLKLTVLGPSEEMLEKLRQDWRKQLGLPEAAAGQGLSTGGFGLSDVDFDIAEALDVEQAAQALVESVTANIATGAVGDIRKVTEPNRASIIVLAEEGEPGSENHRSCLLTGDATHVDIIDGLKAAGRLEDGGVYKCDVLKFQHHGAEFNADEEFMSTVLADHYVFSANGRYENPDARIVKLLIEGRADAAPDAPFTVWFTCAIEDSNSDGQKKVVRHALNTAVDSADKANAENPGLVTIRVLKGGEPFFDICLCAPGVDGECASPSSVTTKLTAHLPGH